MPLPYAPSPVVFVVATRAVNREAFFAETATGRSLAAHDLRHPDVRIWTCCANAQGLPVVYNRAINKALSTVGDDTILVFAHDDVHLYDHHWPMRVSDGLSAFDVIGVAGNTQRAPAHVAWIFDTVHFDRAPAERLSGHVAHGRAHPPARIDRFGPPRQAVQLLDGLFMALRVGTLRRHGLRFDPRFDFHFYDLDFSRQVTGLGLRCGTWDIAMAHESMGSYGDSAWWAAYRVYIDKWGDPVADAPERQAPNANAG